MRFSIPRLSPLTSYLLLIPFSTLAADAPAAQNIVLDVATNGGLGALCAAAVLWLNGKRTATQRTPPLGEDVARNYVTKDEMTKCQGVCRKDIEALRDSIADNDKKAEDRARGTHARIDRLYIEAQKTNVALGRMTGIMIGKGIAPAVAALTETEGQ